MSGKDHEQVSIYPFSNEKREELLTKARECVFNWTTLDGWAVGVMEVGARGVKATLHASEPDSRFFRFHMPRAEYASFHFHVPEFIFQDS